MFNTAGSKGINEPKLKSNWEPGTSGGTDADLLELATGEEAVKEGVWASLAVGVVAKEDGVPDWLGGFGTLKSKVPDLRAMFSCCNRARRSLRFSFSEVAAWFFASKSASLSSNCGVR